MEGSLEIINSSGESMGVVGLDWTADAVPVVVRALYGITDVEEASPTPAQTGRTPDNEWTGKSANNQDVTIRLWSELPFEGAFASHAGPDLAEE